MYVVLTSSYTWEKKYFEELYTKKIWVSKVNHSLLLEKWIPEAETQPK